MIQLFVIDKGFVKVYGMKSEKGFLKAIKIFFKEVGSTRSLIVDPHSSQKSNEVRKLFKKVGRTLRVLEE